MNYYKFYNAWQSFAKPKRELLLEELKIPAKMSVSDFLGLTTTPADLENIKYNISRGGFKNEGEGALTVSVDEFGNAKVIGHDGRHRALSFKLKTMKEKGIGLMEVLPSLVEKEVKNIGGSQSDVEKEINHILLLGYPDKIKLDIDSKTRSLISWTDRESEKVKLDTNIIIANKDSGYDFNNIKKFIGQFDSSFTVSKFAVLSRQVSVDITDPLKIGNGEITITGYDVDVGYKLHADGIQNFLMKKFAGSAALNKDGYREYVKMLDNAYAVVDNNGKEYRIVFQSGKPDWFNRNDPKPELVGKKWTHSTNNIHLEPYPYTIYGDSLEAKEKVNSQVKFTIKKK